MLLTMLYLQKYEKVYVIVNQSKAIFDDSFSITVDRKQMLYLLLPMPSLHTIRHKVFAVRCETETGCIGYIIVVANCVLF